MRNQSSVPAYHTFIERVAASFADIDSMFAEWQTRGSKPSQPLKFARPRPRLTVIEGGKSDRRDG
ncbi:MAG TPA: hypothetical protein VIJ35_19225 [Bradyrhizobium sp.]